MPITTCIFDAYGTLLDVSAAARSAAAEPDFAIISGTWPQIAADWRARQLQYTWLRAITGEHADFWQVTGDALDWTLDRAGHGNNAALRERLMTLYWDLSAYDDVAGTLAAIKGAGLATGILSNGSPDMLAGAVKSAGIARYLDHVLSVESVGIYKPARAVYDMVGRAFGCAPDEVLFVSANGWDVAAAAGYGFVTAWVNRAGDPVDRLPHRPAHRLDDLTGIAALAGVV
jgi:2-haloacid dehalogenase